jgi:hypothetical protein
MVALEALAAEYLAKERRLSSPDELLAKASADVTRPVLYERSTDNSAAGSPWVGMGWNPRLQRLRMVIAALASPLARSAAGMSDERYAELVGYVHPQRRSFTTGYAGTFSNDDEAGVTWLDDDEVNSTDKNETRIGFARGWGLDDRTGMPNGRPRFRAPSEFGLSVVAERIAVAIDNERGWFQLGNTRLASRTLTEARRRAVGKSKARTVALSNVTGVPESTIRTWKREWKAVYANERQTPEKVEGLKRFAKKAEGAYPGGIESIKAQLARGYAERVNDDWRFRCRHHVVISRCDHATCFDKYRADVVYAADIDKRLRARARKLKSLEKSGGNMTLAEKIARLEVETVERLSRIETKLDAHLDAQISRHVDELIKDALEDS